MILKRIAMKIIVFLFIITIAPLPVFAGETVTKVVESDVPIIIDGNWIYPEDGKYTLVLTDSFVTINGYEYVHPPKKWTRDENAEPPSEVDIFCSHLVQDARNMGQKIIDEGGDPEEARMIMEEFLIEHSVNTPLESYKCVGKKGHYNFVVICGGNKLGISVPRIPWNEQDSTITTYREKIEGNFKNLASSLEHGGLLYRDSYKNSSREFHPEEAIPVIRKIKKDKEKYLNLAADSCITVDGIKFSPYDIKLLSNPRKLVERRITIESK